MIINLSKHHDILLCFRYEFCYTVLKCKAVAEVSHSNVENVASIVNNMRIVSIVKNLVTMANILIPL